MWGGGGETGMEVSGRQLGNLVCPANEVEVVFVEELGDHLGAEGEGDATIVLAPSLNVLVRVAPQEVAQKALVWHVRWSHYASYLLHRLQVRREA